MADDYSCSGCNNGANTGSCSSACATSEGSCTSCSNNCASCYSSGGSSSGTCDAQCALCSGSCGQGCESACSGCSGSCDDCGGCDGSCGNCDYSCGSCKGTCKSDCSYACRSTANGSPDGSEASSADSNGNLTVRRRAVIYELDVQTINDLVLNEVTRRGQIPSNVESISINHVLNPNKIKEIASNLAMIGFDPNNYKPDSSREINANAGEVINDDEYDACIAAVKVAYSTMYVPDNLNY